jgi:membrane protein implicated in regulation of membrane protease activity
MNRTRSIFYLVVALALAVVAISLATQLLSAVRLLQIFISSTVFAAGVVVLDFFGVLGHHGDFAGHDTAGSGLGGHDGAAHDVGFHDLGAHDAGHAAGTAAEAATAAHAPGDAGHAAHGETHAPQPAQNSAAPVLSILVFLRLLVYFCLGFGPSGWVAMEAGWGPWRSLLLAVPVGAASLVLARAFFRLQRRDTGAVAPAADLVSEHATVIVPLNASEMGKVRVSAGMTVSDLYALAADPNHEYHDGETVQIVRVTDDCVYVR